MIAARIYLVVQNINLSVRENIITNINSLFRSELTKFIAQNKTQD